MRTFVARVCAATARRIRYWYTCVGELARRLVGVGGPKHRRCEFARSLQDHFHRVFFKEIGASGDAGVLVVYELG